MSNAAISNERLAEELTPYAGSIEKARVIVAKWRGEQYLKEKDGDALEAALDRVKSKHGRLYQRKTLAEVKETIAKWLYIRDPLVIDLVLAAAIAEQLPGDPLWLFLIAPPGGGKTELLRALEGKDHYHLSDLTSKTFISGLMMKEGKENKKIEDLLPQLDKKVLIFKDFTTILEKGRDERREIMAQLREIYDGRYSKKFGSIDHKIEYKVRFGLIAGVTPVIDKYWKVLQQLGERFLKYRWSENEEKTTERAEENEAKEGDMREEIHNAIMGFLSYLEVKEPELPAELSRPLIEAARFLAIIRTPVAIQPTGQTFYHEYIPTPEIPTRLVKQLKKLSKALAVVRGRASVTEDDILGAVKVALSTAPQERLEVLQIVEQRQHDSPGQGTTIGVIYKIVNLPETTTRKICEQLVMLGLLEETRVQPPGAFIYTGYYKPTEKVTALSPPKFLEAPNYSKEGPR